MSSEVNLAGKRDTHQTGAPTPWLVIWRSATSMGCKGVTTGLFSSAMMWNFREPSGSANGLGRTILMVIVSLPWKRSCHTRRMAMGSLTSNCGLMAKSRACGSLGPPCLTSQDLMWTTSWPSFLLWHAPDATAEWYHGLPSQWGGGIILWWTTWPSRFWWATGIMSSKRCWSWGFGLKVIDGGPLTSMLQSSCSSCSVSWWPARQSPSNPQQRSLTCGIELRLLAWICLSEIPPSWFSTSLMCT